MVRARPPSAALAVAFLGLTFAVACEPAPAERTAPADAVAPSTDVLAQGRLDTERFYGGDLAVLHQRMTPALLAEAGDLEGLGDFRARVAELAGREEQVLDEETFADGDLTYYRRTVRFDGNEEVMAVQWGYAGDGAIADFFIRPIASAASVEYRTATPLRLPFDGEWYVTAGGRTLEENQHSNDYTNRFAYDLVAASDMRVPRPLRTPSDYDTWEQPILAPAAGLVVGALGDVPDNPLSVTEGTPRIGNHVVIDHRNGEFSVLGHLREGSLRVAIGDTVSAGDVVGLAGNSGNSTGPHLHYNLQDGPEPNGDRGLPAQFLDYTADGRPVDRGEPTRGEVVSPRASG